MKLAGAWESMRSHVPLIAAMALAAMIGVAGCDGDDGTDGTDGADGAAGLNCWDLNENGVGDLPDEDLNSDGVVDTNDCNGLIGTGGDREAALAKVQTESCSTCHGEVGQQHQDVYNRYVDESKLVLTFDSVSSVAEGGGTFAVTLNFSITQNGAGYVDPGLSQLDQKSFRTTLYDATTRQYTNSVTLSNNNIVSNGGGSYTLTQPGVPYAPELSNAQVYGYIADGELLSHAGGSGAELPADTHVHIYDDQSNAALAFGTAAAGDASAYDSAANVEGCQKCHGTPYLKHGYRAAVVENIPDFSGCKACHVDNVNGGHNDWQHMVDDPLGWATGQPEPRDYTYRRTIMNDTHMSHAMEFPFPTSMATCNTCHEGKLDRVLDDEFFVAETCKSCHAVEGVNAKEGETYAQEFRAPPLYQLWGELGQSVLDLHISVLAQPPSPTQCTQCHGTLEGVPTFAELHSGYVDNIYQADGTRYADVYTVSIDDISLTDNVMTVELSASDPAVVPELLISFYGWDTKHFYIPSHDRDDTTLCGDRGCRLEYVPESSGGGANALFTEAEGSAPGAWTVSVDLSAYVVSQTDLADSIPGLIDAGVIKRAEVSITPELEVDGVDVALSATSKTFVLADGSIDDDYFKGVNAVVIEPGTGTSQGCNICHDSLASTFHDGSGRGGGGIQVCKHCHNPTFGGSHLEMQSRSIESYVHSIHSFQDFDVGDTFEEFDPVFAKRYDLHVNHVFPNFTIRNCEACHNPDVVTYDVPNQAESLFGMQSASDEVATWYSLDSEDLAVENPSGRTIGQVPSYVTGPASRTCGSCHRARWINDDAAGDLASFNAHTDAFGTLIDREESPTILYDAINKIMEMFQ